MSKPAPVAMDSIAKHEPAEIAAFVATAAAQAKVTFLNVAKGIVALEAKVGRDEAKAFYKKAGVTEHTLKNARQAVQVWEDVVTAKHADEAWFDQLTYMDCVVINRAIRAVTVKPLVEQGLFKKRPALAYGQFEKAADGSPAKEETPPQKVAKPAKAPAPSKNDDEGEETTPPKQAKRPDVAAVEKIEAAEKAVLGLVDLADQVTAERVYQRLLATQLAVKMAMEKRWKPVHVEELRNVSTRAS
ncbi:hypothetical protein OpiT1DRAFT_05634 [Opitutaceae bacterium TAV1]|nr:hypothetical protein OpiT1DRAFT_05634 [Opitutaceae bacterium TAV1]